MQRYRVAFVLRKSIGELSEMTVAEFNGWIAFLNLLKTEQGPGLGR